MATREIPGQLGLSTPLGELLGSSQAELEAEFADYSAMGVNWVRTNFWWDLAQPTASSSYDWTLMDKVVNAAAKYGIKIIGELTGKPDWVETGLTTAASRKAYADFAAAAAAHFKGSVGHWEIWNEPNMQNMTPANYTKLLQGAYTAIKAVDSTDVVISGGLAAAPSTANGIYGAVDFLKGMYAAGAKDYFDALGYHPYTYPLLPSNTAAWNGWQIMKDGIRTTMVANGDSDLQVWMTELGAPTAGGANASTQAFQAQILSEAASLAATYSWAGPIMWYSYKDRGGSTGSYENWFGLLGPNGEKKTGYYTFADIANNQEIWATPHFTGASYSGDDAGNTIIGNDLANSIYGLEGNDILHGGKGNDTLWGGAGNDIFVFWNTSGMGVDTIKDFASGDRIDLRTIDANTALPGDQPFTFIGSNWLGKAGDLGFYVDSHGWLSVQGDTNGDGAYDLHILVQGVASLSAGDFLL